MAKKFIPSPEQLELILTRYKETKNYSLVSRETNLSVAIIKRIIHESDASETVSINTTKAAAKPKTTAQILAYSKEYIYNGFPPVETKCPNKAVYYGMLASLKQEFLDV